MNCPSKLAFDEAAHRYRLNGQPVPGVTAVIDPLLDLWRIPADVLKAAADFGTHVHAACDLVNRGELDWQSLDPALEPYVEGWRRWLAATGAVVLHSEVRCYSERHRYAGTADAVVLMPGRKGSEVTALVDVKSGVVPWTVGLQTAAYAAALAEMRLAVCRQRICVQLTDTEPFFRSYPLTDPADWSHFLSALNIHRLKEQHSGR